MCGNFGLLLLELAAAGKAKQLLETMLRVTMMRGAQSAGLVTYKSGGALPKGIRKRVVNGKRTDLCTLLLNKYSSELEAASISAPQLFQGHTRFATSSIAALPGCHPHQWTAAATLTVWTYDASSSKYVSTTGNVEAYITHNGDLDFFEIHGVIYPLEELQQILIRVLHAPMPASVDSACVAGLLDLLRTSGMWHASVRYGYLFGALSKAGSLSGALDSLWSKSVLDKVVAIFEGTWRELVNSCGKDVLRESMTQNMGQQAASVASTGGLSADAAAELIAFSVAAFFEQDLLAASRQLLKYAIGSFGLVLCTSLDARRELVVASRGQTMSIAFYPLLGAFLFGSESAATKAAMGVVPSVSGAGSAKSPVGGPAKVAPRTAPVVDSTALEEGSRFDLDDVNGEVVLLRWGAAEEYTPAIPEEPHPMTRVMRYAGGTKVLWAANFLEGGHYQQPFMRRVLRLGSNPLVSPIPPMRISDPVGHDISDIPKVLSQIVNDWYNPGESLNRLSAYTLLKRLRQKMVERDEGCSSSTVDLLVVGCEVSLWVGEQFASDLHNAFPKLRIVTLSANKLLGQLGQGFPTPQIGFQFNENSYQFTETVCLLLSHSGGTFGALNVSNLLKGFTSSIFAVTAEWDTQVGRSVRAGKPGASRGSEWKLQSFVFTNFCGTRPAEPCSLTVAATHQVLTQILFYLMFELRSYEPGRPHLCGSSFVKQEVEELETLNLNTLKNLGTLCNSAPNEARSALITQGHLWANHILEGPRSWVLSSLYILFTVTAGYTPLSAIVMAVVYAITGRWGWGAAFPSLDPHADPIRYVVGVVDSFIYAFLPWWITVLMRLVQGRTWHHRVSGRSLLVGDIPWVAQSMEAFVSKLFALSYSIATINVSSGNPLDHLVHRHTHRVVRGALLAVGRPDGRADALTLAESTVCLSVNQASLIQNMGVTLESITLGHNPFKLGLSANAIHLPDTRPRFFSEHVLEGTLAKGSSASATLGALSSLELRNRKAVDKAPGATANAIALHFDKIDHAKVLRQIHLGEWMAADTERRNGTVGDWMANQNLLQELYEGRLASLERFCGFLVLFHAMGKKVQDWWPSASCGMLGYDMSRSHSIMRIATTASPVPGSDVRLKIVELAEQTRKTAAAMLVLTGMRRYMKLKKDTIYKSASPNAKQVNNIREFCEFQTP